MLLESWMLIAGGVGLIVLFMLIIGFTFAKCYKRASADEALVRTGSGGTKVVVGGGILSLPVLHQIMRVSLRTVTLTVERQAKQALVTKDKIKACCTMELYIKVDPTEEAITSAAQSFGSKNVEAAVLSEIVEGKLTDALRGVAAVKDFSELHANREEFAEAVKNALAEELAKNGLKLESTSLTDLSQLPVDQMDKNDVHDAVGLRNILKTVAAAQQESNEIENTRDVTIQEQDVSTRETNLALTKRKEFLEADQKREIAKYQAEQSAKERLAVLEQEQLAEEGAFAQEREIENARIAKDEAVTTRDLQRQRAVAEAEASKDEAEKVAQIAAQKAVETATIERQKVIEAANIEKQKVIETASIAKEVAIAVADTEKAKAEAEKSLAQADEASAREAITTAEETARADRTKAIAIIKAREEAEQATIDVDKDRVVSETNAQAALVVAQRDAEAKQAEAEGVANAVRERANAEADKLRAEAQAQKDAAQLRAEADALVIRERASAESEAAALDAEAKKLLADARLAEGKAEAEAKRLLVEAENAVDDRILMLRVAEQALTVAPDVTRELVSGAAGVIGDMKVLQINGLGGDGEGGGLNGDFQSTPVGLGLTTLMQAAAVSPVIKGLMDHAGISSDDAIQALSSKVKAALSGAAKGNSNGDFAKVAELASKVRDLD